MRFFLTLFMLMLACYSGTAHAQLGPVAPVAPASFGAENKQLQTILQLQYQMQILKRIIEREKVVNEMVKASLDVGVTDPYIPQPSYTLCQKVPGNVPCSQAYHDLYPEFAKEIAPPPPPAPVLAALPDEESAAAPLPAEALADSHDLYWLDVTCFVSKCSAIVSPDPADIKARYRITVGEKLPDGAVVDTISADGVTISQGEEQIRLDPAPKTGGTTPQA